MLRVLLIALLAGPAWADDLDEIVNKHGLELVKDRPYAAVSIGLFEKDRDRHFAFGKVDGKTPAVDSMFEIGSVTKVFTGILLAERVQAKVVNYDDPAQMHLPKDWIVPRRDDRDITLLQLATHTSGLPRTPIGFLPIMLKNPQNPVSRFDEAMLKKGLPDTPVLHPMGSRQLYSNLGAGLLGHALAHASKAASYEAILTERVLKPLELNDTTITLSDTQMKRMLPGHDAKGKPEENWDFACLGACGALRSTTADMLKFVKANLNPSGPLKECLLSAQQTWRDVRPGQEEIGLFWVRYANAKKAAPSIWHNGQTGGFHSFVGFVPGRGGIVVLCNVATMKADDLGIAVLKHLAEAK